MTWLWDFKNLIQKDTNFTSYAWSELETSSVYTLKDYMNYLIEKLWFVFKNIEKPEIKNETVEATRDK